MPLEDCELPWSVKVGVYTPPVYHHPILLTDPRPVWADKLDPTGIKFNVFDEALGYERKSHEGSFKCNSRNEPLNPRGRCGLGGRGLLGRWGPNHAADPVITKWARDAHGNKRLDANNNPILEFVAIMRKDTGEWAIPGGMVDPGESVSLTLKREFGEETMASMDLSKDAQAALMTDLDQVFKGGVRIYSGYVDDIRNTDNAWIETTCVNFHDETGSAFTKFKLKSGDDAGDVAWTEYKEGIRLYATHALFIKTVFRLRLELHHKEENSKK